MPDPLRVGVLGVQDIGESIIEVVRRCDGIALAAVADRDGEAAGRTGRVLKVEAFDDFRMFLHAQPLDALVVTAPPFTCHEALRLAAARRLPVWRTPPLARDFDEAVQLVRWFAESKTPLAVGRLWERDATWLRAGALGDALGRLYLAHAQIVTPGSDDLGWRGDREQAGGGALLQAGYDAVDLCVAHMGMPDGVTAETCRVPQTSAARLRHDTEDTAVALLQFGGEAAASVTICRRAAPTAWSLALYGQRGSMTVDRLRAVHWSADGRELHTAEWADDSMFGESLARFFRHLADPEEYAPAAPRDHLSTMAVIESAYLSARTGEPESPTRLFEMQQWMPEEANE